MVFASLLASLRNYGWASTRPDSSLTASGEDEGSDCAVLQLVEEDDYWLDKLRIGSSSPCTEDGQVEMELPRGRAGLSRLGSAIGRNTQIRTLCFDCSDSDESAVPDAARALLDGIKRNKSIDKPVIWGCDRPLDGAGCELLEALGENATSFTRFEIWRTGLGGDAVSVVASFLAKCTKLEKIKLTACRIDGAQLGGLVPSTRAHPTLYSLNLDCNDIGTSGCEAIATLLRDPESNLRIVRLNQNGIEDEGANILADSLCENDKLQELQLGGNSQITSNGLNAFARLLCDTSSTSATYRSNHTLYSLGLDSFPGELQGLKSSLDLNLHCRKSSVCVKKILKSHPNLDMNGLFEWDLKVLPLVAAWFDKAAVIMKTEEEGNGVALKKQDAIYQFVRAMPMDFVAS